MKRDIVMGPTGEMVVMLRATNAPLTNIGLQVFSARSQDIYNSRTSLNIGPPLQLLFHNI